MPEYVRNRIALFVEMWTASKGRTQTRLYADQIKRLWRVIDHHDWWMIVDLFEERIEDAATINYMLAVLEDTGNYDRYVRDPRFYASGLDGGGTSSREEVGHQPVRVERRAEQTVHVGAALRSLRDRATEHLRT